MINHNRKDCRSKLISRLRDGEISPDDRTWAETHIQGCEICRKELAEYQQLSESAGKAFDRVLSENVPDFEARIMRRVRAAKKPRDIFSWFRSGRMLIPAAGFAAAMLLIFFTWTAQPVKDTGPSAIVTSMSGNYVSAVIMETPGTRQTIIWITEDNNITEHPNET